MTEIDNPSVPTPEESTVDTTTADIEITHYHLLPVDSPRRLATTARRLRSGARLLRWDITTLEGVGIGRETIGALPYAITSREREIVADRLDEMARVGASKIETYPVVAEDAPIGVLTWPTRTPDRAPNYTIAEVSTHRTATDSYVKWTYESGSERTFKLGETVICGRIVEATS